MCGTTWTAEYSSAAVKLESQEECLGALKVRERARLSPDWWRRLEQLTAEVRFDELPERIRQTPAGDGTITIMTDDTLLCIETASPVHHQVCAATLDVKLSSDGSRFARLWNHLVAAIPDLAQSYAIDSHGPATGAEKNVCAPDSPFRERIGRITQPRIGCPYASKRRSWLAN